VTPKSRSSTPKGVQALRRKPKGWVGKWLEELVPEEESPSTSLVGSFSLRRHYDCSGRRLRLEKVEKKDYTAEEQTDRLYRVRSDTGRVLSDWVVLPATRQLPLVPGMGYRFDYCNQEILRMHNKRAELLDIRCPWRSP
jgi:hypothetical protein